MATDDAAPKVSQAMPVIQLESADKVEKKTFQFIVRFAWLPIAAWLAFISAQHYQKAGELDSVRTQLATLTTLQTSIGALQQKASDLEAKSKANDEKVSQFASVPKQIGDLEKANAAIAQALTEYATLKGELTLLQSDVSNEKATLTKVESDTASIQLQVIKIGEMDKDLGRVSLGLDDARDDILMFQAESTNNSGVLNRVDQALAEARGNIMQMEQQVLADRTNLTRVDTSHAAAVQRVAATEALLHQATRDIHSVCERLAKIEGKLEAARKPGE